MKEGTGLFLVVFNVNYRKRLFKTYHAKVDPKHEESRRCMLLCSTVVVGLLFLFFFFPFLGCVCVGGGGGCMLLLGFLEFFVVVGVFLGGSPQ